MAEMHEIDYKIFGDDMQFVEVELDPNEATVAEAGGMMYMDDGIEMETIFGDGSQQQGGFMGALMGAGKRLLTGESLFMTVFLNRSSQKKKRRVRRALSREDHRHPSRRDRRRADRAEGLVPRRGQGRQHRHRVPEASSASACSAARGSSCSACRATAGRSSTPAARCTSGRWPPANWSASTPAASSRFQPSVNYEIEYVGKIKSALFGGEGLFFATLRGPGRVWLQSLPLSRLANRIIAAVPGVARGGREEGSILGGLGWSAGRRQQLTTINAEPAEHKRSASADVRSRLGAHLSS